MKIEAIPVMFDDTRVFYDKEPGAMYFGELWHLYDELTSQHLFHDNELPDIFSEASIFSFTYGAILGEFSCDFSPYACHTKNIIKFKKYLDRFYTGDLTKIISQCILDLSHCPEKTIENYDNASLRLKDPEAYEKINKIVRSEKLYNFICENNRHEEDYIRVNAYKFFLENMPIHIHHNSDEYFDELKSLTLEIPNYFERLKSSKSWNPFIFKSFLIDFNERMLCIKIIYIRTSMDTPLTRLAPLEFHFLKTTTGDRLVISYQDAVEFRDYNSGETIALIFSKNILRRNMWTYKDAEGWTLDQKTKLLER